MTSRFTDKFRQTPTWLMRGGPAVAVISLVAYVTAYVHWPSLRMQVDLMVYRFAGERLLNGLDLYSIGLTGKPSEMLFIYPPFAAICAIPLALLDGLTAQVLWLLGTVAALTYVVVRMLTSMGMRAGSGLIGMVALLIGVLAWLEPIRLTAELGQINVVLLLLVVADLLSRNSKWSGVGIGLAAGLKLTPALFIIYLIATKRIRAAAVASATFAATVGLGFLVAPKDSATYWFDGRFDDVNRISHDLLANTSLTGMLLRMHQSHAIATGAAIVVATAAVALAAVAHRRGQDVLALALVGMASAAASPFSWSHHWVWFLPLVVHLAYRGYIVGSRVAVVVMWSLCALLGGWIVSAPGGSPQAGILSLRLSGIWNDVLPDTYVLVFFAVLIGSAGWLWRLRGDGDTAEPVAESADVLDPVPAGQH